MSSAPATNVRAGIALEVKAKEEEEEEEESRLINVNKVNFSLRGRMLAGIPHLLRSAIAPGPQNQEKGEVMQVVAAALRAESS